MSNDVDKHGSVLLAEWIARSNFKTQREAAEFLGYEGAAGQVKLSQYLTRKRAPDRDNALLIQERTGVPARSWSPSLLSKNGNKVAAFASKARK